MSDNAAIENAATERIDIKTGWNCNNRCLFCVQGNKRAKFGNKTTEEVFKLLEEGRRDADSLVFTGGEVTIRPDLLEIVRYAKELKYRSIQIQTNGRMLAYKKVCADLIEAGATEFSPALHGHTAELHDYLVHAPGAFKQTVRAIANLKELGALVITNSVIVRANYRHLPELATVLTSLGVDQYQFAFVHPLGTAAELFTSIVPRMSLPDVECACGFKEIKQAMVGVAAQLSGKASALVAAGAAVIGGGTVKQGVAIDRGEKIVNAMTDKTGLLFIETDPPKAALMINGKPYGNAPYQDELMIGRYIVTASQNSYYHDAAQEIQLTTDGATLKLVLPPAFGTLNVTSTPDGAEVLIDDKPVGKTPFIDKRMKSGQYQVEVRRDLYAPVRRQVTVGDGRLTAESFNLAEDFGSLEVTSNPTGATIIIDENQTGKVTPALFPQLATGLHIVTIDLDGYGRRVENAKIGAGASEKLAVTLEPKMGRLTVMTVDESGAPCVGKLSIDGAPVGQTPWKGDLIATQHKVEARCGDGLKIDTAIVEHNAQKSMKLQMESSTVIKWVRLPGGTFQMGSNDGAFNEEPVRSVTVSVFEIAATEVTVAQYRVCVKAGVCSPPSDGWYDRPCNWKYPDRGNHPVNCLNWHQAETYAKWVGGRLPTEAEWEYAARSGGLNRKYPWGDHKATCDYAIMDDGGNGCGREGTWPVCSKPAGNTEQGLCDMAGNVWEWVYDWYGLYDKATSASGPLTNPMGPPWGEDRGNRGGSWYNGAKRLRTTGRDRTPPNDRNYSVNLGVRPVRSVR